MTYTIRATYENAEGETEVVYASVHDLDTFIHASPEKSVFVTDEEGNQFGVNKGELTFLGFSEFDESH